MPGVPGGWTGTITIRAVMEDSSDETSSSGEGVYATTTRDQSETHLDTSDTFTVNGHDPDDPEFGVAEVDLTGQADNSGTTLERTTITSDEHNALGCHFTDEVGTEVKGPWTQSGVANVTVRFNDDGSYYISLSAGGDPVTGEMQDLKLPKRLWETYTILEGAAQDCPPPGTSEVQDTEGPIISWASGQADTNELTGSLSPSNPGSVLDGSASYETTLPDAKVTASWHLVHEGTILLPNEGPDSAPE